jgi:hypothetical protein
VQEREVDVTKPDDPGQTGRNRNLWIIAGVVLVLACVCLVGALALVGGSLLISSREAVVSDLRHEAIEERTIDVGPGARLQVDNFAGSIDVEASGEGQIRVVAVKHGPVSANLDRIQVHIQQRGDTLVVRTSRPRGLSNLSVSFQIFAPAGTYLDLSTGSGSVGVEGFVAGVSVETGSGNITAIGLVGDVTLSSGSGSVDARDVAGLLAIESGSGSLTVQGISGDLEAHTGSGGIDVQGAEGNVRLDTASGTVEYRGTPAGDCRFETGTGSVVLHLPAELDFRIQADTGSGSVDVQFDVEGRISRQHVEGVVGTGQEATIIASTGSGGIDIFQY